MFCHFINDTCYLGGEKRLKQFYSFIFCILHLLHTGGNISGDRRLGLGLNLIWKVLIKNFIIFPKILMKYGRSGRKNKIFRLPNNYFVVLYQLHMGGNISWDRRLGLGLNLMYKVLVESILLCHMLRK